MSVERTPRFQRPAELSLAVEELDPTVLLRIAGEIDLATIDQVTAAVGRLDLDRISLLVLDLQDVEFLDLSVLRGILRLRDRCGTHGVHVTVMSPRGLARRVLDLTHAHKALDLVDAGGSAGR